MPWDFDIGVEIFGDVNNNYVVTYEDPTRGDEEVLLNKNASLFNGRVLYTGTFVNDTMIEGMSLPSEPGILQIPEIQERIKVTRQE